MQTSTLIWLVAGAAFAAIEIPGAYWPRCPWAALSEWVWWLTRGRRWASWLILVAALAAADHLAYGMEG
jgi:uncharacterized membrane protein